MSLMRATKLLMQGARPLRPQDVFATSLYTGNGGTQTITNGLDLAGKGGLVWTKARSTSFSHDLFDNLRTTLTVGQSTLTPLSSDTTHGEQPNPGITSFNNNGFSTAYASTQNVGFAAWSFRQADKFFAIRLIQHTTGTASTISLPSFGPIGMVIGKNRSASGNWPVWHRSLPAGQGKRLNLTAVASTTEAWISVSGQTVTLDAAAPSGNYVLYVFAHNPDLIDCGAFSISGAVFNSPRTTSVQCGSGWTPQFLLVAGSTYSGADWIMADTARGWTSGNDLVLGANTSAAESSQNVGNPTTTGFDYTSTTNGQRIHLAIRSPT